VFNNEIKRKESRLFEALVATRDSSNLSEMQAYKTAENLIVRQVKQYAIDLEDSIAKQVFKDTKVQKVMWVAEQDHKTCSVCNDLDGQIFDLRDAPAKQHLNCRCYYVPYKE
jgi:SPP1 gp7 family putative phage head morphogenesis protein